MYEDMDLINPACIIDANHSNSGKDHSQQPRICREILHNRKYSDEIRTLVKGVMIESYLVEGNQGISDHQVYGKSITDACLGWEDSEQLLYDIAERL